MLWEKCVETTVVVDTLGPARHRTHGLCVTVRCQWKKRNHQLFRRAQERGPSAQPVSSAPASISYWRRQNPPIWMRMPQLSPSAQLQLPLSIGDDGIPQYGSESLRSAHLSVQLQLTHQLSSSFHFLLATTNLLLSPIRRSGSSIWLQQYRQCMVLSFWSPSMI